MPRRILIVRLSAIGDVVHGLPLARSLRRLYPHARIAWAVQEGPAPLLAGHPWIDEVLLFPRRGGPGSFLRFAARLRRRRFDLAVDIQGNLKSALVLAASRAPERVGLARGDYREALGALAATRRAPLAEGAHAIDRTLGLCRFLGDREPTVEYGLLPAVEEAERAREDLAEIPSPTLAVSVGGAEDVREWPDQSYVAAIRGLSGTAIGIVVVAGPAHAKRARRIAHAAGVPHRAGTDDLRGLFAQLAVLAERGSALLLGCDSAPLHLAVAAGLPVLALSGPQDPGRTGPYGGADRALTAWEGLPCAPCRKRVCALEGEPRACMRRIGPDAVERRAREILNP